jgi:hypothetical protein
MPSAATGRLAALSHLALVCMLEIVGTCGPARAGTDWLVTPEEVARLRDDVVAPLFMPKAVGGPVIEVLRPTLGETPLVSPLPIELTFRAPADAAIDPASFRVFYGTFGLDVTQRLLKAVVVRPDGLRVEQAAIPPGSHRLVLQIADVQQRVSTRELRFTVK